MDYIPTDWSVALPYIFGAIFFVLMLLTYVLLGVRGKLDGMEKVGKLKVIVFFALPLSIVTVGFIFMLLLSLSTPSSKLMSDVQEQIRETYGLELSYREISDLRYPDAQPRSGVVGYGSTELFLKDGDDFLRSEVFLISSEGRFYLADSQGEALKVLSDGNKPTSSSE